MYDAVVIGAGAGGMAAAARLNHYGYRTLLVECRDEVGGRASTVDLEGFKINTGAIVIELGGDNGQAFDELGVDMGTRVARRPLVLKVGKRHVPLMSGPTGAVVKATLHAVGAIARRVPNMRPERGVNASDWVAGLSRSPYLQGVLRNLTTAVFAAEPTDVEAAVFFDYFTKKNALKTYAFHPNGTVGPWQAMAKHFEKTGGTLWLKSTVESFTFNRKGLVDGVIVRRDGQTFRVATSLVVSNAGPLATVSMCGDDHLPSGYPAEVRDWSNPSTLITVNFASRIPLTDVSGLVFFGPTRRLAYAANFTETCPEMAPPGWHLYLGASTPHPATGEFDRDAEVELLLADLREHFPGFDDARILSVEITSGDWPGQRAIAGRDLPQTTPVANIWNVGDGVREWATGGQSACVESARIVTDTIRKYYPATVLRL
ncbi:amine oxidase [Rhodococcus sp. SC4]|nr:amine oxidase [Rhodococcus sp. SC4]